MKNSLLSAVINRCLLAIITILLSFMILSNVQANVLSSVQTVWKISDLDQPESVVYAATLQQLVVSNINGKPFELNQQGYLSRISLDGEMLDQYWVKGLNAPKGMAVYDDALYVADMQTLHQIDLKTGEIRQQFVVESAKMLNDVTVDEQGVVYVSDFLGGMIYRLIPHQDTVQSGGEATTQVRLEAWFQTPEIAHPNGVLWHKGALLIGTWGQSIQADFSTSVPGSLYYLQTETKTLSVVNNGFHLGNIDGIVAFDQTLLISDWVSGEVYQLFDNQRVKLASPGVGVADIGGYENMIWLPMMQTGEVLAWKIAN